MHLDNLWHRSDVLRSERPDLFGEKEGQLQQEAHFLGETLKVQEVDLRAAEDSCGRDGAGLLGASVYEL